MRRAALAVLPLLVLMACTRKEKTPTPDPTAVAAPAAADPTAAPSAPPVTPAQVAAVAHATGSKATKVVTAVPTHEQHVAAAQTDIQKTNFRTELQKLEAESE